MPFPWNFAERLHQKCMFFSVSSDTHHEEVTKVYRERQRRERKNGDFATILSQKLRKYTS